MRHWLAIVFVFALSTCAGPQALAADRDDFTTQQRYELRDVYADATVPPVDDRTLATQPVRPVGPVTINQPNATTGLDFSPVVSSLQQVLNMGLTALIGALATWLSVMASKWLGVKIEAHEIEKVAKQGAADIGMAQKTEYAVSKAVAYAFQMLGVDASDLKNVQIRDPFLRTAAAYMLTQFPEESVWVTSSAKPGEAKVTLHQFIEGGLPKEAALPVGALKTTNGGTVIPTDVAAKMAATAEPAAA